MGPIGNKNITCGEILTALFQRVLLRMNHALQKSNRTLPLPPRISNDKLKRIYQRLPLVSERLQMQCQVHGNHFFLLVLPFEYVYMIQ